MPEINEWVDNGVKNEKPFIKKLRDTQLFNDIENDDTFLMEFFTPSDKGAKFDRTFQIFDKKRDLIGKSLIELESTTDKSHGRQWTEKTKVSRDVFRKGLTIGIRKAHLSFDFFIKFNQNVSSYWCANTNFIRKHKVEKKYDNDCGDLKEDNEDFISLEWDVLEKLSNDEKKELLIDGYHYDEYYSMFVKDKKEIYIGGAILPTYEIPASTKNDFYEILLNYIIKNTLINNKKFFTLYMNLYGNKFQ